MMLTTPLRSCCAALLILLATGCGGSGSSSNSTQQPPLEITTTALANGELGQSYQSEPLTASGGQAPFSWSASGEPAGLILSSEGVISGTPGEAGDFILSVTATDAAGTETSADLSLTIYEARPQLSVTSLPEGNIGAAYPAQSFTVTGGRSPLTWDIASGALPAGMGLSDDGVLSGNPTVSGSFAFAVSVTDALDRSSTAEFTLSVVEAAPQITTAALADARRGEAYSVQLMSSGGRAPLTWSLASGTLPDGLALSAQGEISGMPTTFAREPAEVQIELRDDLGRAALQTLQLLVLPETDIARATIERVDVLTGAVQRTYELDFANLTGLLMIRTSQDAITQQRPNPPVNSTSLSYDANDRQIEIRYAVNDAATVISASEYNEQGLISRTLEDADADGNWDRVKLLNYSAAGDLISEQFDNDNDGNTDAVREYDYAAPTHLAEERHDNQNDGIWDRFYRWSYDPADSTRAIGHEYDANGDGVLEYTRDISWTDLPDGRVQRSALFDNGADGIFEYREVHTFAANADPGVGRYDQYLEQAYDFDLDGAFDQVRTREYDAEGKLTAFRDESSISNLLIEYDYDPQGRLIECRTYEDGIMRERYVVRYEGWLIDPIDLISLELSPIPTRVNT